MNYRFINSPQAYEIICKLSKQNATLRILADHYVSKETSMEEVLQESDNPEKAQENWWKKVSEKQNTISNTLKSLKDQNIVTTFKKEAEGKEQTFYSLNLDQLAYIWVEKMRDYNSPRKTLEQPELKEAIKNTENDTIVGEKMSDEEFLHYYKHVKHKEKQTDVKNHEQFNPWYEFDAVAAGHDPYNIIEYVSNSCRDYIDEEKNAGSTIHEMFEALEESATINRSRRILQTPSTTVKRDAEEVIATAVAHKRTKHTEEKNGEEYIFPHIPHGGWKEMEPIPVIYSLKRKWKRYEGTITEFIKEQTGKEPEFTKDQSESTPQE